MAEMTKEFKELARHAAHRTAPENFTVDNVDEAFRAELAKYCSSIPQFMKNRWDLYEIIIENADEIVPNNVMNAVGIFAETKVVPQGSRAMFKTSKDASKMRAKKFLTRVGLAGVYESFRLDSTTFEVPVNAVGGAATIDFERMLDGAENLAEVMDVLTSGLEESVYQMVQGALRAAVNKTGVPAANRKIVSGFDAEQMYQLCTTVGYYGKPVIFAPPEFIAAMGPDAIVPGFVYPAGSTTPNAGMQGIYHPQDIDAIHNTGKINLFRGVPIVEIPQSVIDEKNDKILIDPQLAYVLPTGGEKVVKVVFEGNTQMYDWVNTDQSMEVQIYRKMGCGIITYHNWGIYKNQAIDNSALYQVYPNL